MNRNLYITLFIYIYLYITFIHYMYIGCLTMFVENVNIFVNQFWRVDFKVQNKYENLYAKISVGTYLLNYK